MVCPVALRDPRRAAKLPVAQNFWPPLLPTASWVSRSRNIPLPAPHFWNSSFPQVFDCGKDEFQKCGAGSGMFRLRETQDAVGKSSGQKFCATGSFATSRGSRRATGQTIREISRYARNDGWGRRRASTVDAERKSRFLAALGMTVGGGDYALDHKVWWVGLGWSRRRGTWSAMRMP